MQTLWEGEEMSETYFAIRLPPPYSIKISDYVGTDDKLMVDSRGVVIITKNPDMTIPGAEYTRIDDGVGK